MPTRKRSGASAVTSTVARPPLSRRPRPRWSPSRAAPPGRRPREGGRGRARPPRPSPGRFSAAGHGRGGPRAPPRRAAGTPRRPPASSLSSGSSLEDPPAGSRPAPTAAARRAAGVCWTVAFYGLLVLAALGSDGAAEQEDGGAQADDEVEGRAEACDLGDEADGRRADEKAGVGRGRD